MTALMAILRKEALIGVTCWELKSYMFKSLVLPCFAYDAKILGRGGRGGLEIIIDGCFRKA